MIQLTKINKHFGKLHVLRDIDLELEEGNVYAMIGPNGCGKTTLIKSLLGMVIPDEGDIVFDGNRISGEWLYREKIGYMPQIGRYPENMTVKQILEMIEGVRQKNRQQLDKELFERFELHQILDKRMRTLSGGTRQKVSAYLAFLFHPQVLILDEPTAGLDPVSSLILKEKMMKERDNGKLILITSHILSELDDVVNQIIYMEDGSIAFNKPMSQLKMETGQMNLTEAIAHIMQNEMNAVL